MCFGSSAIWYFMAFTGQDLSCERYFGSADADTNNAARATRSDEARSSETSAARSASNHCRTRGAPNRDLPARSRRHQHKHSVYAEWLIGTHARFRDAIEAARAPSPPISRARATVTEAPPGTHPVAFAASPCPEDDPFHQLRGRTRRGTCRITRRPAWDRRSGYGAGTGERLPAAGGARWTF